MSTCSCGAEKKQVNRQTAARQYSSEIDFRDPSWNTDFDPETDINPTNPYDPTNIFDLAKDPNLRSGFSVSIVEFEREKDTFCPNFSEHEGEYQRLVGKVKDMEVATEQDPMFPAEEVIDVERLRSKVESLRAEANSLSEAQLQELRDELSSMRESLSSRIETLREGDHRRDTASLERLENLEQETQQVVQNHITAELAEREEQSQTQPGTEAVDEGTPDPAPCDTCGEQQERVTRQTTVRQYRSELEFRKVSFGLSGGLGLFGSSGTVDPSASVSATATANFKRNKETFCSNFSGDQNAYNKLVNDVDTVEKLADRNGPGQYVEEGIDVERVRSKIEALRTEVRDMSEAKLTQLRDELAEMRETLAERIKELENNHDPSRLQKLRGNEDRPEQAQRLQNLKEQAEQVVENHVEEELTERQQQTAATESWRDRDVDEDPSREGAPDTPGSGSCERCDEDVRSVDRQSWLRQQREEMELREVDVGVGINPFSGVSPITSPKFDSQRDEFCANFAGDETAYNNLLEDIDDVATTATRNEIGEFVENSVDVERVRSKLKALPDSAERLSTDRLRQVRDGLTEMRESLEQRVQDLQNHQQWERLRRLPGIDDISKRVQRLQNLKERANEAIQEHLDQELLQRRLEQGRQSSARDSGGASDRSDSGSNDGSGGGTGGGSEGNSGSGSSGGSGGGPGGSSGSGSSGGSGGGSGDDSSDSTRDTDEDVGEDHDPEPEADHHPRSESEKKEENEEQEQNEGEGEEEEEEEAEEEGPNHGENEQPDEDEREDHRRRPGR